ncbi:MAG TPA: hypothetical protein VI815_01595 [Candidatus Nanoarchaeia archaeon]|nr:hypothetical protein [Candidatus Nanoarchaeia archaeon]
MKTILIIAVFLLMNFFFIISNNNIHLTSMENISQIFSIYINWLQEIGKSIVEVTGNVIKLEWVPQTNINSS